MSRRFRRMIRVLVPVAFLILLAAACSSAGHPIGYDDQIGTDGLSNVESNWNEGCQAGFADELAADAARVCACSYSQIKAADGIPFEAFLELNDQLKDNPESLSQRAEVEGSPAERLVDIVAGCIASV